MQWQGWWLVLKSVSTSHTSPSLSLHWLPVHFRIQFETLLIAFKALNGLTLSYITDLAHWHSAPRSHSPNNKSLLYIPWSRLKLHRNRALAAQQELCYQQVHSTPPSAALNMGWRDVFNFKFCPLLIDLITNVIIYVFLELLLHLCINSFVGLTAVELNYREYRDMK